MPDVLQLEGGGNLLLEGGGNLLLESGPPRPKTVEIGDWNVFPGKVTEQSTPLVQGTLVTEEEGLVDVDDLLAVLLQVYDQKSNTVVRALEDVLPSGSDVVFTQGTAQTSFEWKSQAQDTYLIDRANKTETRVCLFHFLFGDSSKSGSLTNPFTTVADSREVTVALTAHGMASTEDHNVFFSPGSSVGGVLIGGTFNVKAADIIDADSFKITLPCKASSSAAGGGGTVPYWINARSTISKESFLVNRSGPACS